MIKSIELMKCGKVAGTSLIVAKMVKASGVVGAQHIRDFEKISSRGCHQLQEGPCRMGGEYRRLRLQGQCVALQQGNYRCLKLLDQVMKVLEMLAENLLWHQMRIDHMQFGFRHNAAPLTSYSLYATHNKSSVPSTRHCTWPLSIWKRLSIMYTHVSTGRLIPSLASRSGWWTSYRACMKMPEAECVLVAIWRKSLVRKWEFNKALLEPPTVHHGSGSPLPLVSYRMSLGKPIISLRIVYIYIYSIPHHCQ